MPYLTVEETQGISPVNLTQFSREHLIAKVMLTHNILLQLHQHSVKKARLIKVYSSTKLKVKRTLTKRLKAWMRFKSCLKSSISSSLGLATSLDLPMMKTSPSTIRISIMSLRSTLSICCLKRDLLPRIKTSRIMLGKLQLRS